MNIFLYLKGEKIYYLKENKEDVLIEKFEDFVRENKKNTFFLIFSKLNVYFRKVEFDFKDKKKIGLIIGQEIEGKLPKSSDSFYFYFEYNYLKENKTSVNVFAIEKEKLEYFKKIFEANKVKYYFSIDTILLLNFLKTKIIGENFIGIFVEDNYFILNVIENGVLSNVYSYFSEDLKGNLVEVLNLILSSKKLPVYYIGKKETFEDLKFEELKFITEKKFNDILKEIKKIQKVNFEPIFIYRKTFSFEYLFYLAFLFFLSFFFITPYFEKNKKEKKIEEINQKMENIFKSIFPETKKIVNPLVQIKEKILQTDISTKISLSEKSIIKILEEVTLLFPEDTGTEIEEFTFVDGNIYLTGSINNLKDIDRIKENVKKSKIFSDFEISGISVTKENKVKFNLLLKMVE
ncbi:MAG: hypothetical protein NC926_05365 [Candidatus Omnitrophica bacterium]|nr:hypothetical protein [Candidatus Omnitrophota bacterium]